MKEKNMHNAYSSFYTLMIIISNLLMHTYHKSFLSLKITYNLVPLKIFKRQTVFPAIEDKKHALRCTLLRKITIRNNK